jgi:hypothetical protein
MKKILVCIFLCLVGNESFAQNSNDLNHNLSLFFASSNQSQSQPTLGQNLMDMEGAYSMKLDNKIKYATTFFEMRQLNRYYTDLETWQRAERLRLKRSGLYDRDAIRDLYGR